MDLFEVGNYISFGWRGLEKSVQIDRIEETHSSRVILSKCYALKIKKAVNLGFLDYSTVQRRSKALSEEFRLGNSMSPSVYYGVGNLVKPNEPVLIMRRLAAELRADRFVGAPSDAQQQFSRLALACVEYYKGAKCLSAEDTLVDSLISACESAFHGLPDSLMEFDVMGLKERVVAYLDVNKGLFRCRVRAGWFREGHGDLRLEHIYFEDPICFIDPLEFSPTLRMTDIAADLCFLAMELDYFHANDASKALLDTYASAIGDRDLDLVANVYKCYRAVVRSKVEFIQATQSEGDKREQHLSRSVRFLELAARYRLF